MTIAVDFDGTCVTHNYPDVGIDIGAEPVLKELVNAGHDLIINTMRSGKELHDAIQWFYSRGIRLRGANENPSQKSWTTSPKVYANLYIDDAALGCPLVVPVENGVRPYVDWVKVRKYLVEEGILV